MPLENLERRQFMSKIRSAMIDRIERGGRPPAYTGGPTGGKFGVMTGSQPTAAESTAFNDRVKNRALHGSYGKGGILREGAEQKRESDLAKAARQRRKDEMEEERHRWAEAEEARKADEYGPLTPEKGTPYVPGTPVAPALRDAVPGVAPKVGGGRMTIPEGPADAFGRRTAVPGTYNIPGEYDPSGSFLPSKQRTRSVAEIARGLREGAAGGQKAKTVAKPKKKTWRDYAY